MASDYRTRGRKRGASWLPLEDCLAASPTGREPPPGVRALSIERCTTWLPLTWPASGCLRLSQSVPAEPGSAVCYSEIIRSLKNRIRSIGCQNDEGPPEAVGDPSSSCSQSSNRRRQGGLSHPGRTPKPPGRRRSGHTTCRRCGTDAFGLFKPNAVLRVRSGHNLAATRKRAERPQPPCSRRLRGRGSKRYKPLPSSSDGERSVTQAQVGPGVAAIGSRD